MLDQVAEQLAAPADAALEEREAQVGEAPGHAAEEQRLGDVVAGRGEVTDMVEGEVRRAVALAIGAAAGMEGRRDAELAAFLPQRVVIVFAVEAELIEALGIAGEVGGGALGVRDRPAHAAAEHADLCTQLLLTNVNSSIASSGVCTGITAAGVSLSPRSLKYSWVTTLKPRITARRVASSAIRGMPKQQIG